MKNLFKNVGKLILWLIALVLVLLVVAYLTASYWIVPLIKKVAPQITQTNVSLQSADISPISGRFALKGLKIGNPKGFTNENSFKMNEVAIQFEPASLLSNKIIMDKILIDGTQISMEINNNGQTNLMVLNENVQNYLSGLKVENDHSHAHGHDHHHVVQPKTTPKTEAKSVVIKDLQILNSSVQFGVMGKMTTLKLPNIQEKNIGEKQETSLKDGVLLILNKLTIQPVEEITKAGQKALTNALNYIQKKQGNSETVKELKKSLAQFFG